LIEDDDFSHEVDKAELSLIEEYLDGTLPPGERLAVETWINGSPTRRAHAAITAGLRYSATRLTKRRSIPVWSWAPIAASLALLIALPYLHHRMPSPSLVSPAGQTSRAVTSGPIAEDTILLEAKRLRSSSPENAPPTTYRLHVNQPTRIQIALPAAAPRTTYSADIYQGDQRGGSPVIHRIDLPLIQVQSLSYLELHVPPGSLSKGEHLAELHSANGAYRLQFSVEYLP
jgi:hypothetical protein